MKHLHLLWLALILSGCAQDADNYVAPQKPVVQFVGNIDPALVGAWTSEDQKSQYVFAKDGTFTLKISVNTPGGKQSNESKGQWKVAEEQLLIQDESGNVVPYRLKKGGNKVTLQLTGTMKGETVLNRH